MSPDKEHVEAGSMARVLQPLLWFLLMSSTLACASNLALDLVR